MNTDSLRIQELIERPKESLSVEIKRWVDPDHYSGIAKIVKAALALRNHGGGYLIIGFDDKTLDPDTENIPENVCVQFHIDKIQKLISRFASESFEVSVEFPQKDGQKYPVILIPSGIKTPVASKSEYKDDNGKILIKLDTVYVRSLLANNTPSTTQASWKDWTSIVEVCFDNREADIGKFLRRHLAGITIDVVQDFLSTLEVRMESKPTHEELLKSYLQKSENRFNTVEQERKLTLPTHGCWEVALHFDGDIPEHTANIEFLNLLNSSNPDYTGWPVWLDSRGFSEQNQRPFVVDGTWESMIVSLESNLFDQIDFMRFDPKGKFYLRRAFQDDISRNLNDIEPMKYMDFSLPVLRSAEAIAVGLSFAKAMKCDPESTQLVFAFKWSKLHGRKLVSWVNPMNFFRGGGTAYQNEVLSVVLVPLEIPLSVLGDYVHKAVKPLFEIFDGFSLSKNVIDDLTQKLVQRNL